MICGILFSNGWLPPKDKHGCHLENGHEGPHVFIAEDGDTYQWETDLECSCDHCMKCEGDYCTVYGKVDRTTQEGGSAKEGMK